jgi:hypothetical protein
MEQKEKDALIQCYLAFFKVKSVKELDNIINKQNRLDGYINIYQERDISYELL